MSDQQLAARATLVTGNGYWGPMLQTATGKTWTIFFLLSSLHVPVIARRLD